MKCSFPVVILLFVVVFFAIANTQPSLSTESQKATVLSKLSAMPLSFTENRGQWDQRALFRAEAGGAAFFFCKDEVVYLFTRDTDELVENGMPDKFNHPRYRKESMVLRAQFVGANLNPEIAGQDRLSYNCNYFIGNDSSRWATNVPNYSSLTYKDIYPGIDLKYHGDGQGMKYDFIINPGADISQIRIKYEGAENLSVTNQGDLEAQTRFGPVNERIPQIYQEIDGQKTEISGHYILGESGVFGFTLEGGYNPLYSVVIDPVLDYSTYLGGSGQDFGYGIAVDASNCAYVTGYSTSTSFPPATPIRPNNGMSDAFVAKLSLSGNSLVYYTYLGGSSDDEGHAIAVDGLEQAYVTGITRSNNFPRQDDFQDYQGGSDAFVTMLSSSGSIVYSTYLGGNDEDCGNGIAVDGSRNVYATGETWSDNFPKLDWYQEFRGGGYDAFVTKITPPPSPVYIYSTYLGGDGDDCGNGIAVDVFGLSFITGYTQSTNFPTLPYQADPDVNTEDAFVTELWPNALPGYPPLLGSTYLGGVGEDGGTSIAIDAYNHAYVTGWTYSNNFPTTQNTYQEYYQGFQDAFVTKLSLSPSATSLIYSTYLGGIDGNDCGYGIAVDVPNPNSRYAAYVTGITSSTNFPVWSPPYQTNQPGDDVFVTKLCPAGNALGYSTYLGGNGEDCGRAIAVIGILDSDKYTYVTGLTVSSNFPTHQPYQYDQSSEDAFVTKLGLGEDYISWLSIEVWDFPGGYPLPGVIVSLNKDGATVAMDTTDTNGTCLFGEIDHGRYDIVATKTSYYPDTLFDVQAISEETTYVSVQLVPESPSCQYVVGDANNSHNLNGLDVTFSVSYFKGAPPPPYTCDCPPHGIWYVAGDVNGSCSFNGLDVTYMVAYLKGGPPPHACPDCPPAR